MPRIQSVGLSPFLRAAQCGRIGRLREVGPHITRLQLLDNESPARAAFNSEGCRPNRYLSERVSKLGSCRRRSSARATSPACTSSAARPRTSTQSASSGNVSRLSSRLFAGPRALPRSRPGAARARQFGRDEGAGERFEAQRWDEKAGPSRSRIMRCKKRRSPTLAKDSIMKETSKTTVGIDLGDSTASTALSVGMAVSSRKGSC